MKKLLIAALGLFLFQSGKTQFSIATDLSLLRNFSDGQSFTVLGQTVQGQFHVSKKETFYAWIGYYEPGRVNGRYTTRAKQTTTAPAFKTFIVNSTWRFRELSLGWKHYFKSDYKDENKLSIYSLVGFGLLFNKINNVYNVKVDTALFVPVQPFAGNTTDRKITFDLGVGGEFPFRGSIFLYADARTYIPASSFVSPYLHNQNKMLPVMINVGLRVLFSSDY